MMLEQLDIHRQKVNLNQNLMPTYFIFFGAIANVIVVLILISSVHG